MATRTSAGILLFRRASGRLEVLLAHPGGPFFVSRDAGYWTIPKGEVDPDEELIAVARREFEEETGHPRPGRRPDSARQHRPEGRQDVHAWALEGDLDPATAAEQHVRDDLAAGLRPAPVVPGDRPGRVVRPGRGTAPGQADPDPADRSAGEALR